jgi:competence protein ComEC
MATALASPHTEPTVVPASPSERVAPSIPIWQAPLVPIALAVTAGIVADRSVAVPLPIGLVAIGACLVAWAASTFGPRHGLALLYLWGAALALGAAWHHAYYHVYAEDDIAGYATGDPTPVVLRGVLDTEPIVNWRAKQEPLRTMPATETTRVILRVTYLKQVDLWESVSGRAQLTIAGTIGDRHVGETVEVVGRLIAPQGPANPGEFDYAAFLRDQRVRALVSAASADAITKLADASGWSIAHGLARIRGWGQQTLRDALGEGQSGVAMALLLGDGSTMTGADWEKYIRTGVIHVLAISGQHLVILAGFLWATLRLLGVRRRRGAIVVMLLLLAYALLVGGRPPVLRAAVMVCALCGGLLFRRPVMQANALALAWLIVVLINPTDAFNTGCQLSFLTVAILWWGIGRWQAAEPDPLAQLEEESRPPWQRMLRRIVRQVGLSYLVTLIVWLAVTPLVAARYHVVSPIGLLLGPPLVLLASIALLSGFLLLLFAFVCRPIAPLFAEPANLSLAACEALVTSSEGWLGAFGYVSDIPNWWLWVFYLGLFAVLTLEPLRRRWRVAVVAALAWICVGLLGDLGPASEFRCTFLAVGHGGCTVIETPDGRTLLYDAGSMKGPEVTQRHIAPYLWHRGIRRIDEVFLSHADLDHFNGLPALLERFAVGQVTATPSFSERASAGVGQTLNALARHGVPMRIVKAGDCLHSGSLRIEVLHPPAEGPSGNENARSMVLLISRQDHTILLTGDLEGTGLDQFGRLPPRSVDVMMAPHHGSRKADPAGLARWARPRVVVACLGPANNPTITREHYESTGARFLATWPDGAISLRDREDGLSIDTFLTRRHWLLDR